MAMRCVQRQNTGESPRRSKEGRREGGTAATARQGKRGCTERRNSGVADTHAKREGSLEPSPHDG